MLRCNTITPSFLPLLSFLLLARKLNSRVAPWLQKNKRWLRDGSRHITTCQSNRFAGSALHRSPSWCGDSGARSVRRASARSAPPTSAMSKVQFSAVRYTMVVIIYRLSHVHLIPAGYSRGHTVYAPGQGQTRAEILARGNATLGTRRQQ